MALSPKEALNILEQAGYAILPELKFLADHQYYKNKGIVQVWECPKCKYKYEAYICISAIECKCRRIMKKIFPK